MTIPRLAAYFTSESSDQLVKSVQAAERAGYGQAYLNDAHTLWQDCYVHMTRALDRTDRIRIGTGVTNPVTRHFTVAASAHATLAEMHPGRVVLGIGRGDAAVHALGMRPMSTLAFRDTAMRLRALLHGEAVEVEPAHRVQLRWLQGPDVPLLIAATGPRNLVIAGAVADIVQIQVGVRPAAIRWALEHVHRGIADAGREPTDVEISVLCAMWVDDDAAGARAKTRWAATTAVNHIEEMMRRAGDDALPPEMTRVVLARRAHGIVHDYDRHLQSSDADTAYLTDDLIDDYSISGDAATCRARLEELAEVGVHEVASGFFNGEIEQLERAGSSLVAGAPTA